MTATIMIRKFKSGSTMLPDPDPSMTPDEVRKLYAVNYPHLAQAEVLDPRTEGDELIYEFTPPVVKTKG